MAELDPDQDPFAADALAHLVKRFGSPLLVIDAARLRTQYRRLSAALPGVDLHYALKPLPHAAVIQTLGALGASFDLATNGEVELVRHCGIAPERCIHTHPIKRDSDIRTALEAGVTTFVVDNPDELRKFEKYGARAQVLIRVSFRSPDAVCDLSRKFGCAPEAVEGLLGLAGDMGVAVTGLSFHVGSQAHDPRAHVEAIHTCRDLMQAALHRGEPLTTLDIGGGFPVDMGAGAAAGSGVAAAPAGAAPAAGPNAGEPRAVPSSAPVAPRNGLVPEIEEFCAPIVLALASLPAGVRVIAEPGRFIAAPAAVGVASVMGRAVRDGRWWYYLDDGLYGSYSGQMYDHSRYPIEALAASGTSALGGAPRPSVLAGPTCDSIDVIAEEIDLPPLEMGDLVVGRMMGAYTWASASEFNFFPRATVVALDGGRHWLDGSWE
jgi:ornithine decarboxylase